MAAIGTRELTQYINERGMKLWEVKIVIPTGTTGTTKHSQNIGINGTLQILAISAPNLVTDPEFGIFIKNKDGHPIGYVPFIDDNKTWRIIHAMDMVYAGGLDVGSGMPVFNDDYIEIFFATAQTGGSLDFEVILRGI